MKPTTTRIERNAYYRWEHRGRTHGHDQADWIAAERRERFDLNYRLAALLRVDDTEARAIVIRDRRRCRFCGQGEPRASFPAPIAVFAPILGHDGPKAWDQCDDCLATFAEAIDDDLAQFGAEVLDAARCGGAMPRGISAGAFKGLVKTALAIVPESDLQGFEDATEWVGNPDHAFDLNVFRGLSCSLWTAEIPTPFAWAGLAVKTSDDEPWPSHIFFLNADRVTFALSIPLGSRDEDEDIVSGPMPEVLPPSPFGIEFEPTGRKVLPIIGVTARPPRIPLFVGV